MQRFMRAMLAVLLVGIALAGPADAAPSAVVVGTGTSGSCTEAAFDTALAAGGTVTFNCGGPKIISATLQVLLNLTRYEMPPSTAVPAPRLHHQWMPDTLLLEPALFDGAAVRLKKLGHPVQRTGDSAVVQAVSRLPEGLQGASDPRKHGKAAGF